MGEEVKEASGGRMDYLVGHGQSLDFFEWVLSRRIKRSFILKGFVTWNIDYRETQARASGAVGS